MNSDAGLQDSFSSMGGYGGEVPFDDASMSDFQTIDNSKKNTEGAKKGVQFRRRFSMEEVKRISRVSTYNMEEVISYWGDDEDHILRKSELLKAVQEMHYHRRASDSNFTTLGIDDIVGSGKDKKVANRSQSRMAVMDEQDLQHHEGVFDDDLMADVYFITSRGAKEAAHVKAERLHQECLQEK